MNTKNIILLVEDDPQQAETIKNAISRKYAGIELQIVETESEFYSLVDEMISNKYCPRLVICDVMLPWTHTAPNALRAPEEVREGTFRKAGLRCWKKLRTHAELQSVPWVHFTVLDKDTIDLTQNLDNYTLFTQKCGSIEALLNQIDQLLSK